MLEFHNRQRNISLEPSTIYKLFLSDGTTLLCMLARPTWEKPTEGLCIFELESGDVVYINPDIIREVYEWKGYIRSC